MSDVTRTTRPAAMGAEKRKDESAAAGATWMPGWLRGAGLDKQEDALKPGNQPGFEEQEAARRPDRVKGKSERAAADKGNADETKESPAERPAALKYLRPSSDDRTSTSVFVTPGAKKGVKAGDVVSWGHVQGVIEDVWEFRAKVRFPVKGGAALVGELFSGYGGMLDFGPPQQEAPGAEKEDEVSPDGAAKTEAPVAAAKKPKIIARPGTPRVTRFAEGRDEKAAIARVHLNVYFGLSGQKLENAAVVYTGSFENEDIVREVLESLQRVASADVRMHDLTEDDLRPHAEKIARVIRGAK